MSDSSIIVYNIMLVVVVGTVVTHNAAQLYNVKSTCLFLCVSYFSIDTK